MTIASQNARVKLATNALGTVFPLVDDNGALYFAQASDLVVVWTDANGDVFPLTLGSDYTIAGDGTIGNGALTSVGGTPLDVGTLVVRRKTSLDQQFAWSDNDGSPSTRFNAALDRRALIDAEAVDLGARAFSVPAHEDPPPPAPARQQRVGFAVWNTATGGLDASDVTPEQVIGDMSPLIDQRLDARAAMGVPNNWGARWIPIEAANAPFFADFQATAYKKYGATVLAGAAFSLARTGVAYYPRESFPLTSYADSVARLTSDGLIRERAATNKITHPNFDDWAVGIVGSGGSMGSWSNDGTYQWQVVSLTTDASGVTVARVTVSRTGGAPAGHATAFMRPIAFPGITVAQGMAIHGMFKVISMTGVTLPFWDWNESTSGGDFVTSHATQLINDGNWHHLVAAGIPLDPTNIGIPQFSFAPTSDSADFSITFDMAAPMFEISTGFRDITTFHPQGTVITRDATNLIQNPSYSTGVVGVIGSGGAFPTGMSQVETHPQTVEIVSIAAGVMRLHISGAAARTAQSNCVLRFTPFSLPISADGVSIYAHQLDFKLISSSGCFQQALVYYNDSTSGDVFIAGRGNALAPLDGTKHTVTGSYTPAAGDHLIPQLHIDLSDPSAAYDVVFEISNPFFGKITTPFGGRGAETAVLDVPDGTWDVLCLGAFGGYWDLGIVAAGGAGYTVNPPNDIGTMAIKKAIAYPAGVLTDADRTQIVDTLDPVQWAQLSPLNDAVSMLNKNWTLFQAHQAWSAKYAINRRNMLRFEVRNGDFADLSPDNVNHDRNRVSLDSGVSSTQIYPYQTETWMSARFKLESGDAIDSSFCVLFDWHNTVIVNDHNFGNFFDVGIRPGDFFYVIGATNPDSTTTTNYTTPVNYQSPQPIARDVWHSVVVNLTADQRTAGGVGKVKAWFDGVKVVDYAGPIGYSGVTGGIYAQAQLYRALSAMTNAVQIAHFESGTADLSARILNPKPIV